MQTGGEVLLYISLPVGHTAAAGTQLSFRTATLLLLDKVAGMPLLLRVDATAGVLQVRPVVGGADGAGWVGCII